MLPTLYQDDHRRFEQIRTELQRAGLSTIMSELEVWGDIYSFGEKLEIRRRHAYWAVDGKVPLPPARSLYRDPVGKTDIRVAGHCTAPPPEDPWVSYFAPDGRQVISVDERPAFQRLALHGLVHPDFGSRHIFADEVDTDEIRAYVTTYHIDSELGLALFVRKVREWSNEYDEYRRLQRLYDGW